MQVADLRVRVVSGWRPPVLHVWFGACNFFFVSETAGQNGSLGVRSAGPLAAPLSRNPRGSLWIRVGVRWGKPRRFTEWWAMVCGCLLRTQQCVELCVLVVLCQFMIWSALRPRPGVWTVCESQFLLESLILAQDERWRRA